MALGILAGTSVAARPVPAGMLHGCPPGVLPLTRPLASYARPVRSAVLHFVATTFARSAKNPKQFVGARTTGVELVRNWLPSGWIRDECGRTVWERSIAVFVYFPAMDLPHNPIGHCNDCDHTTFIASRTATGWTVWGVY